MATTEAAEHMFNPTTAPAQTARLIITGHLAVTTILTQAKRDTAPTNL